MSNSSPDSHKQAAQPSSAIVLTVKGMGHVPAKKNHHFPLKNGGLGIDASVKRRMARLENAILFALCSEWQTIAKETSTECSLQSWIRSVLPEDDCWQTIPQLSVEAIRTNEPEITIIVECLEMIL